MTVVSPKLSWQHYPRPLPVPLSCSVWTCPALGCLPTWCWYISVVFLEHKMQTNKCNQTMVIHIWVHRTLLQHQIVCHFLCHKLVQIFFHPVVLTTSWVFMCVKLKWSKLLQLNLFHARSKKKKIFFKDVHFTINISCYIGWRYMTPYSLWPV